jgi:hypothetical protein
VYRLVFIERFVIDLEAYRSPECMIREKGLVPDDRRR